MRVTGIQRANRRTRAEKKEKAIKTRERDHSRNNGLLKRFILYEVP